MATVLLSRFVLECLLRESPRLELLDLVQVMSFGAFVLFFRSLIV